MIKMINCPLCGNPICSSVGFDCGTECLNSHHTVNELECLQVKNKKICRCGRISQESYFKRKCSFNNKITIKEMIIKIADNCYLPDKLFEI
jgi:hypothetical protein